MTLEELKKLTKDIPQDTKIICDTGWEFESEIGGLWYSEDLKELHLAMNEFESEAEDFYDKGFVPLHIIKEGENE